MVDDLRDAGVVLLVLARLDDCLLLQRDLVLMARRVVRLHDNY